MAIKQRIDPIYTDSPFYGSRRITAPLVADGHAMNRKRLQRYMREMGIAGIAPGLKTSPAHLDHVNYPS